MPGIIANEHGKITVSEDIIANIAGHAATESCGVGGYEFQDRHGRPAETGRRRSQ